MIGVWQRSYLRGKVIANLLDDLVLGFVAGRDRILQGENIGDLFAICKGGAGKVVTMGKELAGSQIYLNHRKVQVEIGAFRSLETLLDCFIGAAWEVSHAPDGEPTRYKTQRIWELMGGDQVPPTKDLYQNYMTALDFIAGMTDDYAVGLARQLSGN